MTTHNQLNDTYRIIRALGGVASVATITQVSEPAVYKWIARDKIPGDQILTLYYWAIGTPSCSVGLDEMCHHLKNPMVEQARLESPIIGRAANEH